MINSCRRYNDSENEKRTSKVYKRWQINEGEDEERQDLPADYESDGYIPFSFFKISNCPVNLGKRTRSLTHRISIKSKKYQVKY